MSGLKKKIALFFILFSTTLLFFVSAIIVYKGHVHFQMFSEEVAKYQIPDSLVFHVEQAILESIIWIVIVTMIVISIISTLLANLTIKPLLEMKDVAHQMAHGAREVKIDTRRNDELGDLATSLNNLSQQLQSLEQKRQEMTKDIAHELRNPLATLKSHLEALEDGIWQPTYDRIHSCTEEVERLIGLVKDLELLNSLDTPEFSLKKEEVSLAQVIQQTIDLLATEYRKKKVTLVNQIESSLIIKGDSTRCMQIFMNIMMNALKYTEAGGTVRVLATETATTCNVTVADTGKGIQKESLEKIFDRLYREDQSRSRTTGGSGIGLAIVKRLVEAHEGEIYAESDGKLGTNIHVIFPRT